MEGGIVDYRFKASGKVLIAGGYGVLEQGNYGLSLGLNRHYFCICSLTKTNKQSSKIDIQVQSPQIGGKWGYLYNVTETSIQQTQGINNSFLLQALYYSLSYCLTLKPLSISNIKITILFDRGFLSQPSNTPVEQKFVNYPPGSTKTGLGSSACVTVAVVGSVIGAVEGVVHLNVVNVVSQMANLAAQGKIGSNFDISTAVYGSHLYTNVLPRTIMKGLKAQEFQNLLSIDAKVESWNKVGQIMLNGSCWMLDLRKGSDTRKMVGGFVKKLDELGQNIKDRFFRQSKQHTLNIYQVLTSSTKTALSELKQANLAYRKFLQQYSDLTGIPVEPKQLRPLIDSLTSLPIIAYGICPGSGGYDAIFLISILPPDKASIIKQTIEKVCSEHEIQAQATLVKPQWKEVCLSEEESTLLRKIHYEGK